MMKKYPNLGGLISKILISNDISHLAIVLKICDGNSQQPIAVKTRLKRITKSQGMKIVDGPESLETSRGKTAYWRDGRKMNGVS